MAAYHIHKILDITGYMETHIITLQKAAYDLSPPWDHIKYTRRREGGMMKKADLYIRPQLPKIGRHHPKVVFMYPYNGILICFCRRLFGKSPVYAAIMLPMAVVEFSLVDKREQHRPESFFRKYLIKDLH